jgi:hypothetical protein
MSPEEQAELAPPPTAARRRRTTGAATGPRKPRSLVEVVSDTLRHHRGKVLMDCRWYCVCGWTSSRNADGLGNLIEQAESEARTHQAEMVEAALKTNAQEETR